MDDTTQTVPLEALEPRRPWTFGREALEGAFSRQVITYMAAWLVLHLVTTLAWARHLRNLAGNSSLPAYWGDLLTARDLWELFENGGLKHQPIGALATVGFWAAFCWMLWAGWRVQARAASVRPGILAWVFGALDALVIGVLPLGFMGFLGLRMLSFLGGLGIEGLGWLNLVGRVLVQLGLVSVLMLQWWLCRLNRAGSEVGGWRLGGWVALGRHLGHSFLRLWLHPLQWSLLVLGGVVVRSGLSFLVLALAWRWGGGSLGRLWAFALLQLLAAALGAWALAWFMKIVSGFWSHDVVIRNEIQALKASLQS